jgi:hypothetical protein
MSIYVYGRLTLIIVRMEDVLTSPELSDVRPDGQTRRLADFEFRLKGRDRVKEKVAVTLAEQPGLTATEALHDIPDMIRYTFMYEREDRYARGIPDDLQSLEAQGFGLVRLKNFWTGDQYKGITSLWRHTETGCLTELQFHTRISFEAKQITQPAYDRLRSGRTVALEEIELEAFLRNVYAAVPTPCGAASIPDYPAKGNLPRYLGNENRSGGLTYYALVTHRSSRERPAGVLRRIYPEAGGRRDEAFNADLVWRHSPSLASAERGDLQNEFTEISALEANLVVERIRAMAAGPKDH